MGQYWAWLSAYGPDYMAAAALTLAIALVSAAVAIVWGGLLFFLRITTKRWGGWIVDGYVQLFRNTPVLLPIYLIYFGFPMIGLVWPAVVCGGLALVLQNGAYISEIFRGGFKAIDRIQFDAARSIGLSPWTTFRKVTAPQVLVYCIPSLGNQVVLLLKDTSLLSAIAVVELAMQAKLLTERTGAAYEPFIATGVLYLALVSIVEIASRLAQRSVRWR
jgi:His/Glu/Gln/Arg/opine family amino acid ABC transporter permease subunit